MAEAVAKDFRALMHAFAEQEGVGFGSFAAVWRQMQFSLMHCAVPSRLMQAAVWAD
jgi:hypothetical protein